MMVCFITFSYLHHSLESSKVPFFFIHFESILRVVMGWDFQYPNNLSVFTFFDLPTSILAPQSMALFEAKLQKVS